MCGHTTRTNVESQSSNEISCHGNIGDATGAVAGMASAATEVLSAPLRIAKHVTAPIPLVGVVTVYMDKDWEKIHNFLTDYEVAVDNCDRCQSAVKFLMNFGTSAATAGKKIGNHKISKGQFSKFAVPLRMLFQPEKPLGCGS